MATFLLLKGILWKILIDGSKINASSKTIIAGYGWCFLLLQTLPYRIGEIVRVIWVKAHGGSEGHALTSIIVERLIDIIILSLVFGFGLLLIPQSIKMQILWIPGAGLVCFSLLSLALVFSPHIKNIVGRLNITWEPLGSWIRQWIEGFSRLRDFRLIIQIVLLSLTAWSFLALGFQAYLVLFGFDLPFGSGFILLALLNFAAVITVSPANLGVFEAVGVAVLYLYGISPQEAIVAIVGLHFATVSSQIIYGLSSRLILKRQIKGNGFFHLV